jgi:hypothetical protein
MEICIIKSLHWYLNPPTPFNYLDVARPLIDACAIDEEAAYETTELARYLVELGICDGFFIDKKPSSVAYAAILVATEILEKSSGKIIRGLGSYQLDKSPHVTELCVQRLRRVYSHVESKQSSAAADEEEDMASDRTPRGPSPTSVFQG